MANKRDIKLDEYNISAYAYRELKYFCYQYGEKKKKMQGGYEKVSADVCLIEQAAAEAGAEIYPFLLEAVTTDRSYVNLKMMFDIPCGEKYFNKRRRKFFYLLAKKRGMVMDKRYSEKLDGIIKLEDLAADKKSTQSAMRRISKPCSWQLE